jgi:hypothetical protein
MSRRTLFWSKTNAHWACLFFALILLTFCYLPGFFLSSVNSDDLTSAVFFRDVVTQGHNPQDWAWSASSFLFPDVITVFISSFLFHGRFAGLETLSCVLFLGYLASITVLYLTNGGKRVDSFFALLLVLFLGIMNQFGLGRGFSFQYLLIPNHHGGIAVMTLLGLFSLQRLCVAGYSYHFWVLSGLTFLSAASDGLFLVIFVIPSVLTLIASKCCYRRYPRLFWPLIANIVASTAIGFWVAPYLFPVNRCPVSNYAQLNADAAFQSCFAILYDCNPAVGGMFGFLLAADLATVVIALVVFVNLFTGIRAASSFPFSFFSLLVFCAFIVLANWSSVILFGDYLDLAGTRYVCFALFAPMLLLLAYLHEKIPWTPALVQITCISASLLVCFSALWPPKPFRHFEEARTKYFREAQTLVPFLQNLMARNHIKAGLCNYWYANVITYTSDDAVQLRAVTNRGSIYYWVNNSQWYTGYNLNQPPPKFGLILMDDLNPALIKQHYGPPDQIVQDPFHHEIWLYSAAHSISYNAGFGNLFNDSTSHPFSR